MKHWLKGTGVFGLPALLLVVWLLLGQDVEPGRSHSVVATEEKAAVCPAPPASPTLQAAVKSDSKPEGPRVRLDNLSLGMTRDEAVASQHCDAPDDLTVGYSDGGTVTYIAGGTTLTLESGQCVRFNDDKQFLLDTCGPPDKSSPGLGGCGSDPMEYLYYRVDGGLLLVNVFKPGYPTPEHSEVPKEFWNKICGFTLFVPREKRDAS